MINLNNIADISSGSGGCISRCVIIQSHRKFKYGRVG